MTQEEENTNTTVTVTVIDAKVELCTEFFDSRIIEKPYYLRWGDGAIDYCSGKGKIDYEGLTDFQKLCLYVYAWNTADIYPSKKGILKTFGWTNYKLQKLIRELKGKIVSEPTFSEYNGLLSGRGYLFCA